jgi:predicted nuclease with RNAse H fold
VAWRRRRRGAQGFDAALVDDSRLLALSSRLSCAEVVALAQAARPDIVAVDSPRCCAPDGHSTRDCERALARSVCGIRWTPDRARVESGDYYGWVREGLHLYEALRGRGLQTIEVFPTASWTRWHRPRGAQPRGAWSRAALAQLRLDGVPQRLNQDQRDAIAAALTARDLAYGLAERIGDIVVPAAQPQRNHSLG